MVTITVESQKLLHGHNVHASIQESGSEGMPQCVPRLPQSRYRVCFEPGGNEEGPDVASTIEEAEEAAWAEIEKYLQNMPPYDFQNLVAAPLRAMDYHVSWIAPPGPDKGIDILAHTDPLAPNE